MSRQIVLVKHAQPVLDDLEPAREWLLGGEGEAQSSRLAASLRRFAPFHLVSSAEPKAFRTCEIVASQLGIAMTPVEGLREIDRPVLPIVSVEEHQRWNAQIFRQFEERVVGAESAREALDRFSAAVLEELRQAGEGNLVVVAHGAVISLFVAAHNDVDAFELWKKLRCPSFAVLETPSLTLVEVVAVAR